MNGHYKENWYCIYTKPQCEGLVAGRLGGHPGIEILNPKIRMRKYSRGRMKEVVEELFPCYIFSRFDPAKYYHMVTYTRGVREIVGIRSGKPSIVDDVVIGEIASRLHEGFIRMDTPDFREGDEVAIQEGPLRGLRGVLSKYLKAKDRVIILLNTLSFQGRVEVDRGLVGSAE